MTIDMATPGMERLAEKSSPLEKIGTGFMFTEGPVWHRQERVLRFSDIPANQIKQWSQAAGVTTYRDPSAKSNGMTYDRQGRLVVCEHAGRRVSRTEADGSLTTLAIMFEGKRLNSPNDVVCKSDGAIYFSDPEYGIVMDHVGMRMPKELAFQGVFRISPDGKKLDCVARDFTKPNGLAFSPDEKTLYVDDTEKMHIRAFDVKGDGTLANSRVFATLAGDGTGRPDGMKVDSLGNVYCTGPGGVHVLAPDGKLVGRITTPASCANLAWGEDDWKTLFLTVSDSVYRLRMKVAGVAVGKG
ncbi:MAG: SMP-30/gluconolactonase/LRE family protein [Dehalococcoidia bacterium]|nr:SMP-30/gluconolactonase/LRE family protein [Dehalococcoidia bacterium]